MKKDFVTSILYTVVVTVLVGLLYPLLITGLARLEAKDKANGQLITRDGVVIGSRILAQPFSSTKYFHPRPSAAGMNGYDASNSGGTNYGPTNQKLVDRVKGDAAALQAENPHARIPVDLVTASGSGLDPDITPAAAEFQVPRVAKARGLSEDALRELVRDHTKGRQLGFLGEARVNVLEMNLALDARYPGKASTQNKKRATPTSPSSEKQNL
jgi:potassium-transporting ATPase KdpC subunit